MMQVTQFVMAYRVEQDRIRAMLPEGFESLRPVLRINGERRTHDGRETLYLEFNTPVAALGKRGWLNIARWDSGSTALTFTRHENTHTFRASFLEISFTASGVTGGCPAEGDNQGCFYPGATLAFVPAERIDSHKEYCTCAFAWHFDPNSTGGVSVGSDSIPAIPTQPEKQYPKQELTAQNAAAIPCRQVLGSYMVTFDR